MKLLDQLIDRLRVRHDAFRTEQAGRAWALRDPRLLEIDAPRMDTDEHGWENAKQLSIEIGVNPCPSVANLFSVGQGIRDRAASRAAAILFPMGCPTFATNVLSLCAGSRSIDVVCARPIFDCCMKSGFRRAQKRTNRGRKKGKIVRDCARFAFAAK